jgi:hypothetical protein
MKDQKCVEWQTHANRFRAREMGPTVTLSKLGFNHDGNLKVAGNCTNLAKFIETWDALEMAVGTAPPTNVTEWLIRVRDATAKAKLLPIAPQLNSTYLLSWHVRALLRDRMASAGITKLAINTECSIYQLMNLCPDQSSCLREVYQYLVQVEGDSGMTAADFLKHAATADTPPELLSMWRTSCTHYYVLMGVQRCIVVDLVFVIFLNLSVR